MKTLSEFVTYIADIEAHNYMDGKYDIIEYGLRQAARTIYGVNEIDALIEPEYQAILKKIRGI